MSCTFTCTPEIETLNKNYTDPELMHVFNYLNRNYNSDLSVSNQTKLFFNYAISHKKFFNVNNAFKKINVLSSETDSKSELDEITIHEMDYINSYVIQHGLNIKSMDFIRDYKKQLLQSYYENLSYSSLKNILFHLSALEFLINTSTGKAYTQNIKIYVEEQIKSNSSILYNSSFAECAFYLSMVGYYTYYCMATPWPANVFPCAALAYYLIKAANCQGGGGTNPCNGSNNPCCGISCIMGYVCFNGQCVADPSYSTPTCPDGCYWSSFECVCP